MPRLVLFCLVLSWRGVAWLGLPWFGLAWLVFYLFWKVAQGRSKDPVLENVGQRLRDWSTDLRVLEDTVSDNGKKVIMTRVLSSLVCIVLAWLGLAWLV